MDCRKSSAPDHPNLKVVHRGPPCKQRKTFCFAGLTNEVDYRVYNNSLSAIERAIKERIFFVKHGDQFVEPYRPSYGNIRLVLCTFSQKLKERRTYTAPLRAQQFAESYQGRRRAVYLKAAEENVTHGFTDDLAQVKMFMKCEKYNFTAKPDAVPRAIQPRDPRYIVESGRYIKPIEKKIYKAIDDIFGATTVFKGLNAQARGKSLAEAWDQYRSPVAISVDAKRFDQHVSNGMLLWEHSMYRMFYPGDKYFTHLMSLQRDNKCVSYCSEGTAKYTTKHGRMSGDSNTSLGNVLIMCGSMYSYFKQLGISAHLVNDGDDCVIITDRRHQDAFIDNLNPFFNQLGFDMGVDNVCYELEKIVFCQSQPVFIEDGYTMVRDPRTAISKDLVAIKPLDNNKVKESWLSAVADGGLSLTAGMPIWQEFYSCLKRASNGARPLNDPTLEGGFFRLSIGMTRRVTKVSPETRASFHAAFSITPAEQDAIEAIYMNADISGVAHEADRFLSLPM